MRRDSIMRWAMILRTWFMGTRSPGIDAGAEAPRSRAGAGAAAAADAAAGLLQKCGDVLLGDAAAQAGSATCAD